MATVYHVKTRVNADGSVNLHDLPPLQDVDIVVLKREPSDLQEEMASWFAEVRARHPFATMTKDEILKVLRKTREEVWQERHEG
jgi:hypothetical protein